MLWLPAVDNICHRVKLIMLLFYQIKPNCSLARGDGVHGESVRSSFTTSVSTCVIRLVVKELLMKLLNEGSSPQSSPATPSLKSGGFFAYALG